MSEPPLLSQLLYQCAHLFQQVHDETFIAAARLFAPQQQTALPWSRPSILTHTQNDLHTMRLAIIGALLRSIQAASGMIIICEDLHTWMQDDQETLLALWAQAESQRVPLLLLTTSRQAIPWASRGSGVEPETLELTYLDAEDFPEFCRAALFTSTLPEALAPWLYDHSEGHPLHANELLHLLLDSGALRRAGTIWTFTPPEVGDVPEGLKQVLMSRLYSVQDSPGLWRCLCALAIVDRAVDRTTLATLTGDLPERTRYTLQRAQRAALVRSEQRQDTPLYTLSHPLYPELIQSFLSEAQFHELHLRALEVAESNSQRAYHARLAEHPDALELTRSAAKNALSRLAFAEALQHLHALMQLGEHADDVLYDCGYAYLQLGQAQRAIETWQGCNHPLVHRYRAEAYARLSHFEAGLREMRSHPNAPDPWHPMLESMYCSALARQREAKRLLDTIPTHAADITAYEYAYCYYLYAFAPEKICEIIAKRQQSIAFLEVNGPSALWPWSRLPLLMTDLLHAGKHPQATETAKRYRDAMRYLAIPPNPCRHHRQLFYLAYRQGDLTQAYEHLYAGYRVAVNLSEAVATGWFALRLAQLNLRQGFYPEAANHLYHAKTAWQDTERQASPEPVRLERYLDRLQGKPPAEAPEDHERRDLPIGDEHYLGLDLEPTRVLLLEDQAAQALAFLQQKRGFLAGTTPEYHGLLGLALASLEQSEEAAQALELACTLARSQGSLDQGWLPLARQLVTHRTVDKDAPPMRDALAFIERHHLQGDLAFLSLLYPSLSTANPNEASPASVPAQRFVRVLGPLRLEEAGRLISWKATKPKELFSLLLLAYFKESGPGILRETLMTSLWPESSEAHAASSFRVTLQRLRTALGSSATIERNTQGAYYLSALHADIIFFLEALEHFDDETALRWYGGSFLGDIDLDTAELAETRQRFTQLWRTAALRFAAYGEPQRAVNALARLLEHDPLDIEVHQQMHRSLQALGDPLRLQQHIVQSRKRWLEEIGEIPLELADLLKSTSP